MRRFRYSDFAVTMVEIDTYNDVCRSLNIDLECGMWTACGSWGTVLPEWAEQANDWLSDGLRSPDGTALQVGNTLVKLEYRPVVGTGDGIHVLILKALRPD